MAPAIISVGKCFPEAKRRYPTPEAISIVEPQTYGLKGESGCKSEKTVDVNIAEAKAKEVCPEKKERFASECVFRNRGT